MTASQTFWTILLDAVLSSFGTIILFLLTWEWGKALLSPVLSALYYPIFHILEKRLTPPPQIPISTLSFVDGGLLIS